MKPASRNRRYAKDMGSLAGTSDLIARLPARSRIAVIRLRSMGDCVLTTPALALLKAHRPDLQIHVVVEPRFAGVFEDNPDISAVSETIPRPDPVPRIDTVPYIQMVLNL